LQLPASLPILAGALSKIHSYWQAIKVFVFPIVARGTWSFFNRWIPRHRFINGLPEDRAVMTRLFSHVQSGRISVVLDTGSPYPFTTEGVRRAYRVQESRHGHGKVVVQVEAVSAATSVL